MSHKPEFSNALKEAFKKAVEEKHVKKKADISSALNNPKEIIHPSKLIAEPVKKGKKDESKTNG